MKKVTIIFFVVQCILLLGGCSQLLAQPIADVLHTHPWVIEANASDHVYTSIVASSKRSGTGKERLKLETSFFEKEEDDKSACFSPASKGRHYSIISYDFVLDYFQQTINQRLRSEAHSYSLPSEYRNLLLQEFQI